jgi:hypothetical protein
MLSSHLILVSLVVLKNIFKIFLQKKIPRPLVRKRTIPSDRRLSAKLVPTFADRGCRVVSGTDPSGR